VEQESLNAAQSLQAFASNFPGFQTGLIILALAIGFGLVTMGLYNFATYGKRQRQGQPLTVPVWQTVGGTALMGLGAVIQTQHISIFSRDTNVRSILDFQDPSGSEAAMLATVLLGVVTFFGWIGIFRAWVMAAQLGGANTRHSYGDVIFVLIISTVAANPLLLSDVIANTFAAPNYLRQVLGQ